MLATKRERSTLNTTLTGTVLSLLLCKRSKHHNWPQTSSHNIQKECGNNITVDPVHNAKNSAIQNMHTIQAWSLPLHSWLAVEIKSHRKQKWRNWRHKLSTDIIKTMKDIPSYMSMHDIQEATQNGKHPQELEEHIIKGCLSLRNKRRQDKEAILDTHGWTCNY